MGCPLCLGTALSVFPGNALRFCSQSHMCGSRVFYFRFILGLGKKNHGKVAPEIWFPECIPSFASYSLGILLFLT